MLHSHLKLPRVLTQIWWQPWSADSHSSFSTNNNYLSQKKDLALYMFVYPSIRLIAGYRQKTVSVPLLVAVNLISFVSRNFHWYEVDVGGRIKRDISHFKLQLCFRKSEIGLVNL